MAANEEKRSDYYEVLGLKKECSAAELRNAYKKLAMVRIETHPLLLVKFSINSKLELQRLLLSFILMGFLILEIIYYLVPKFFSPKFSVSSSLPVVFPAHGMGFFWGKNC